MSIRDEYIKQLSDKGYPMVKNYNSKKYVVFKDIHCIKGEKLIFLGSHSAVRHGITISNSMATSIKQFV